MRGEVVDPFADHHAVRVDLAKSSPGFRQQLGQAIHIRPVGVGMVVPFIVTREHLLRDLVQLKIAETITLDDAPRGLEKVASVRVAGTDLVVEHLAVARGGVEVLTRPITRVVRMPGSRFCDQRDGASQSVFESCLSRVAADVRRRISRPNRMLLRLLTLAATIFQTRSQVEQRKGFVVLAHGFGSYQPAKRGQAQNGCGNARPRGHSRSCGRTGCVAYSGDMQSPESLLVLASASGPNVYATWYLVV